MESPLRDDKTVESVKNKTVESIKGESPKTSQKRKSNNETSPNQRKKVQIKMEVTEQLPEPCCSAATVENVLEDMEEEIDNALEQPCYKDKLTPTNVKSILRHIIANEYVLRMVRDTMKPNEGGELGDIPFEPKLTRSKAKEMRKQQCSLPWPVASPAKTVQKGSKKLLEEEFPDESSGDEDYRPEEECHSEDDGASKASESGTPRSKRRSVPSSPVSKTTDMMSEDENALIIALPEFDIPLDPSEADKIALRTRSKLCLNNTPLEEIEASFIAPDITMDMYDTQCDDEDWQSFLSELVKPIDSTGTNDHPDDANDPEYKAIEDEIPDYEDLRYEQITTDEWNDLMLGTYELAQADLSFLDDEDEEEEPIVEVDFQENAPPVIWMTSDERLQLDEQMRMYVQLLVQSHLLSHENSALENLYQSTKIFLEEMKMFATRERASTEPSAFYAHNLDGALEIVKKFEVIILPNDLVNIKQKKKPLPLVPNHIMHTLATSKVFIYPELLPTCGLRNIIEIGRNFTAAEDNLITLGLVQFEGLPNPVGNIRKYIIPYKSADQIRARIKQCKLNKRADTNSIKYYLKFKKPPTFQRVIRTFDPDNIKAPEDYAPNFLPKWMESFSKFPPPVPDPSKTTAPKATQPKKYAPILPRGLYFTSLQYINPDPQTDSKKRPRAPSICDSESPYNPPPLRPLKPKPPNYKLKCLNSKTKCSDMKEATETSVCDSESDHDSDPEYSDIKETTETSVYDSESDYDSNSDPEWSGIKETTETSIYDSESDSDSECSDVKETTETSESLYKAPALEPKPRFSDSLPECSNIEKRAEKFIVVSDTNEQFEVVVEPAQNDQKENVPSPVKSVEGSERYRNKLAAQQAVWASLSGYDCFAGVKPSKGKIAKTKVCEEMDKATCDSKEDSIITGVSPKEKRQCAKKKIESSASSKTSNGKTVKTEFCGDEEELEASIIQSVSKMGTSQTESSAGSIKSSKRKTATANCEEMEEGISGNEEEFPISIAQTVTTRSKGSSEFSASAKSSNDGSKSPKGKTVTSNSNKVKEGISVSQTVTTRSKRQCAKKSSEFSASPKSSKDGSKSSKGKSATANSNKVKEGISVANTVTTRSKRWCVKNNSKLSARAKSSKENTATTAICDEIKEGSYNNKEDSEASVATRGKKHCAKKKQNQDHRDLEPEVAKEAPMKEEQEVMCANSYLLRATEILKDDSEVYEKFLSTLCKYQLSAGSPVELYSELKVILKDYPALVRDFIVFLRPEQAKECGRYEDHMALSKVREFFRKLEVHFKDEPEHINQILKTFAQLQVDLSSTGVISILQPLLKNHPHLLKELKCILSSSN